MAVSIQQATVVPSKVANMWGITLTSRGLNKAVLTDWSLSALIRQNRQNLNRTLYPY